MISSPISCNPHIQAMRALQELKRGKPVYKGCRGCLTDDCDHWDDDTCKDWVPCLLGRTLKRETSA